MSRSDLDKSDLDRKQAQQTALNENKSLIQLNTEINTNIKEAQTFAAVTDNKIPLQIEKPKETTGYLEPIAPYVDNTGAIVGGVIGGLIGLAIIIYFGAIFFYIKLSEKKYSRQ